MQKKVDDIVSKYYKKEQVKKMELRGDHLMLELKAKVDKTVEEKMKKELYNVGIGKVSVVFK